MSTPNGQHQDGNQTSQSESESTNASLGHSSRTLDLLARAAPSQRQQVVPRLMSSIALPQVPPQPSDVLASQVQSQALLQSRLGLLQNPLSSANTASDLPTIQQQLEQHVLLSEVARRRSALVHLLQQSNIAAGAHVSSLTSLQQLQQRLDRQQALVPAPSLLRGVLNQGLPSLPLDERIAHSPFPAGMPAPTADRIAQVDPNMASASAPAAPLAASSEERRVYVDSLTQWDVISGRGGRSNNAPGNKRFRNLVRDMKRAYRQSDSKRNKTNLSRTIVEQICKTGGRFVKKDDYTERYYILSMKEARKKTSQALRETKDLKSDAQF